jgi:hypothetical protein
MMGVLFVWSSFLLAQETNIFSYTVKEQKFTAPDSVLGKAFAQIGKTPDGEQMGLFKRALRAMGLFHDKNETSYKYIQAYLGQNEKCIFLIELSESEYLQANLSEWKWDGLPRGKVMLIFNNNGNYYMDNDVQMGRMTGGILNESINYERDHEPIWLFLDVDAYAKLVFEQSEMQDFDMEGETYIFRSKEKWISSKIELHPTNSTYLSSVVFSLNDLPYRKMVISYLPAPDDNALMLDTVVIQDILDGFLTKPIIVCETTYQLLPQPLWTGISPENPLLITEPLTGCYNFRDGKGNRPGVLFPDGTLEDYPKRQYSDWKEKSHPVQEYLDLGHEFIRKGWKYAYTDYLSTARNIFDDALKLTEPAPLDEVESQMGLIRNHWGLACLEPEDWEGQGGYANYLLRRLKKQLQFPDEVLALIADFSQRLESAIAENKVSEFVSWDGWIETLHALKLKQSK